MYHPPSGTSGLLVGLGIFLAIGTATYFTREYEFYNLDPQGKPGAFEPFLAKYIRAAEYIIGLATGSIVLLVGSSALHGQSGRLPWFYASPLLLLALCVVYGITFMVWVIYNYEEYQHHAKHTALAYSLSLTLGFSALACFCLGMLLPWLCLVDFSRYQID
jgi:hypothetical protein